MEEKERRRAEMK